MIHYFTSLTDEEWVNVVVAFLFPLFSMMANRTAVVTVLILVAIFVLDEIQYNRSIVFSIAHHSSLRRSASKHRD